MFKFVCRQDEISDVLTAIKENYIVFLHCQTNSGLTHFLKRVMQMLWDNNTVCFYVDAESNLSISEQIIGQTVMFSKNDSPEQNKVAKLLRKHNKSDLIYSVVTSCLFALDVVPLFPNIGTIANSLLTSIKETLDADQKHIEDFKTEKAVAHFCEMLTIQKKKNFILLIDDPSKLSSNEHSFLQLLQERFNIRILFAFYHENLPDEIELISKYTNSKSVEHNYIHRVDREFNRPDDSLIEALYECYETQFSPERLPYYEMNDRNIHVIMADIRGLPMDVNDVNLEFQFLLKVLATLETAVPQSILFQILRTENIESMMLSDTSLQKICESASSLGMVIIEDSNGMQEKTYALSRQMSIGNVSRISFAERQSIITAAIRAMDAKIETLDCAMLEFAITHLEHDYSHAKRYIIARTRLLHKKRCAPLGYLDRLNYFDNIEELIFAVSVYYDYGVYDKPYRLLKAHSEYYKEQDYQLALALICERLHIDNYVDKIENLFNTIENPEKKCLIAAVLFVAYLNSDDSKKYMGFFDKNSSYYYASFQHCHNYYYLLRNISYYIEDVQTAINNYEKCLDVFFSHDPVNYNRTISNYICYLMRNDQNEVARKYLEEISSKAKTILDYSDPAYSYLNNNFGIYLTRYTNEDPTPFFASIPFSTGTTETPYIYAQVNLALYYLKRNPILALRTMNSVEDLVQRTSVPRTKQFYAINRALIEYANGIFPNRWLDEIKEKPLRGNDKYAQHLCQRYSQLLNDHISFDQTMINELSLPGYIFYRYFKAEKLFSNF